MAFNFSWIVPHRVGGMARPRPEDAEWLRAQGVTAVLALTEGPPPELSGIEVQHLPVPDMTSPSLAQVHLAVAYMKQVIDEGGAVVAHCGAGMGRTGTILAAFLVGEGATAEDAMAAVRAQRPGSIETASQEQMIRRYAELLGEVRR